MTFNLNNVPNYILYVVALMASAAISIYSVRKIIFIMTKRKIFDTPDNTRKIHAGQIPTLGGIGVFIGYMVVVPFFMYFGMGAWHYVIASTTLLFFAGVYDDLMNMRPSKKLLIQLLASAITVYFADIRLNSLYGIFGITDLPYWLSIALTTVACTLFINAFNFIDGIDGLACTLTILYIGILGFLFTAIGAIGMAGISFGIIGAALGLLYYNRSPARIYMGDTGSMFFGFTIFVLSMEFLIFYTYRNNGILTENLFASSRSAFTFVLSLLFLPVYDAFRVFILRASRGTSPLKADRTHLHYYLLDAGFTHSRSVTIIVITNVLIILVAYLLQSINPLIILFCLTALASLVLFGVYRLRQKNFEKGSA